MKGLRADEDREPFFLQSIGKRLQHLFAEPAQASGVRLHRRPRNAIEVHAPYGLGDRSDEVDVRRRFLGAGRQPVDREPAGLDPGRRRGAGRLNEKGLTVFVSP